MNNSKVLESRKITNEEYNIIINLISKYKLNFDNFIMNSKTLVINKVDYNGYIYNGYDSEKNIISYNDKSNMIRELLHVASSTRSKYQGICFKPNKVFPETIGRGLNEGIADMFLELCQKEEGDFPFEKICAKVLKHVYTVKIYNYYFLNNDLSFRYLFGKNISSFLINLDDYTNKMLYAKYVYRKDGKISKALELSIKVLMTVTINKLLELVDDSEGKNRTYLFNQLKSKTMKPIYEIIGEYNYEDYHK